MTIILFRRLTEVSFSEEEACKLGHMVGYRQIQIQYNCLQSWLPYLLLVVFGPLSFFSSAPRF